MTRRRGFAAAGVLAAAVWLAPTAPLAPAHAQESGAVRVNLVDSVGSDWFAKIGDRTVVLSRIEGIDPATREGQQALSSLDVPELLASGVAFPEVGRETTVDGTAELSGFGPGAYYLTVLDGAEAIDARVSYAPAVVVIAPGSMTADVVPKAQVLGVATEPLTSCNTPAWKDAAAPGTYVEYDYSASVPNLSKDLSIGLYSLTFDFSRGHTVQWRQARPDQVAEASKLPLPHRFSTAAGTVGVQTRAPWWSRISGGSRREESVVKLEVPSVTVVGAGESRELAAGLDYVVEQDGDARASFTLTEAGRSRVAHLRAVDPNTTVRVRVPARANAEGPWGTVSRAEVMGTLETTATLRTDGMDASRAPVTVARTSHVNVVKRPLCFTSGMSDPAPGGGFPADPGGQSGREPDANTPGQIAPGDDHRGGGNAGGDGAGDSEERAGGSSGSEGWRGLASTGAGVIGITILALALILMGLVLRRRKGRDE